jgi:hypothetical protein
MSVSKVYASYAWKVEDQTRILDKLEAACRPAIKLMRDKNELRYRESIRTYMDELAAGDAIVLVLSDAYFKSQYCMYELCEIYQRKDFLRRVFPIVVKGTHFHKAKERIPYISHWEQEAAALDAELKSIRTGNMSSASLVEMKEYESFARMIDELLSVLGDMNALTQDIHVGSDFAALLEQMGKPSPPNPLSRPAGEGEKEIQFTQAFSRQGSKPLDKLIVKRIQQLEEQLDLWQDKLHEFEMELGMAEGANARSSVKQRIKREITPAIAKITREYSRLATQVEYEEAEAEPIVAELVDAIDGQRDQLVKYEPSIQVQLDSIRQELRDLNKSATAKLKVALPIVPTLVSYELDLDTENFLTEIWGKIRGLLGRKAANPL